MHGFKWVMAVGVGMALAACGGGSGAEDSPAPPQSQLIDGTVQGLVGGTVVLQLFADSGVQEATVRTDGAFAFPQAITGDYFVTVRTPPPGLDCMVSNSEGDAAGDFTANVFCHEASFLVGGSITSDPDLGDALVELRNTSNGETLTLASSGDFTFAQPVAAGGPYDVVVSSRSPGLVCSVDHASGTASHDVTSIAVSCTAESLVAAPQTSAPSAGSPVGLKVAFVDNGFNLTWEAVTVDGYPAIYRLFEDSDGIGPQAGTQIGGMITANNFRQVAPNLLMTHFNARYAIQACSPYAVPIDGLFTYFCRDVSQQVSAQVVADMSKLPNYRDELDRVIVAQQARVNSLEEQVRLNESKFYPLLDQYSYWENQQTGKGKHLLAEVNELRARHLTLVGLRSYVYADLLPYLINLRWTLLPAPAFGSPSYQRYHFAPARRD